MLSHSLRDDLNGGWLKTDNEARPKLNRIGSITAEFTFDMKSPSACSTLVVDRNKGDDVKENCRNRLVAREKHFEGEDGRALPATFLFSAMHPVGESVCCGA